MLVGALREQAIEDDQLDILSGLVDTLKQQAHTMNNVRPFRFCHACAAALPFVLSGCSRVCGVRVLTWFACLDVVVQELTYQSAHLEHISRETDRSVFNLLTAASILLPPPSF